MSPRWKKSVEVIGHVLAILAIGFAAVQYYDSQKLKDKMKELLEEASTQYIGSFPGNIDYIVPVIEKTQKDLVVLADVPGYGAYYDPNRYRKYEDRVLQLRKTKPPGRVRMLLYSNAAQSEKLHEQFKPEEWEKIKSSAWFKEFFGTFHFDKGFPGSYDQFISRLLEIHAQYEKMLCYNGVEIEHGKVPSLLYFWVEDEDSAVFDINNGNGDDRELSFRTSDGKLIKSFRSTFERLWKDNEGDASACRHQETGALAE